MKGEHPTQDLLQRYLDGELTQSERLGEAELSVHVQECSGCAAQNARLRRMQALLAQEITDQASAVDVSRMFQNIEAGIAAASSEVKRANGADGAGAVVPMRRRPERRFSSAAPVLGALALAAAVMLMVYRPEGPSDSEEDLFDDAGGVSEVTDVTYGTDNAGTVIDISLADGSSTPVVWIDDWDEE